MHKIYGAVVHPGDNVTWVGQVSPEPMIPRSFTEPAVASSADSFTVAYNDVNNTTVRGRAVYPGEVNPVPNEDFEIQTTAGKPALASDGEGFLLVYESTTNGYVMGRKVGDSMQSPFTIYDDGSDGRPDVTCMADSGTFLAVFRATQDDGALMARMTTLTEVLGDEEVEVCTGVSESYYAAATSDINFGVVWQQDSDDDFVQAQRVNTGSALVGPRETVVEEEEDTPYLDPHVAYYIELKTEFSGTTRKVVYAR